ncbi:small ribosomal subunit protein uS14m-like [Diadema antillarum]|uniref:small ribosomal subunit protein uS14m-like n=1 Tax=Diadema antillarum TaxID=105358 RepID=UPI003A89C27F
MDTIIRSCVRIGRSVLSKPCPGTLAHSGWSSWTPHPVNAIGAMITRTYYADWRMLRDVKRRRLVKEHHRDRLRVNCIRKNTILPDEVREIADQEIAAFPRDSCHVRIRDRCAITSRPRAVLKKWRLSRIMWRSIADANNMSGVQRSTW